MSQYLFGVTVNSGLVTAVKFQAIPASDLPLSGVVAGGYTAATIVVDQYGRITSASSNTVGAGTVTSVSVVTANGVSGSVANATTTPAITITLGAITPTSVAASGTVTGSNLSGTNTGDQTITLTGNVTGSGTGSFATTIAAGVVTTAMLASAVTLDAIATAHATAADVNINTHKLTNVVDPVSAQDAATKNYVDTQLALLAVKQECQTATTTALAASTYNNGSSGVGATITITVGAVLILDGYTPALNDRILVKNQASALQNGIYTLTTVGAIGISAVLTRALDFDVPTDGIDGAFVFIQNGTVNASTGWLCTTYGSITFGTTAINWTQDTGSGTYTGTAPITVSSSNVISLGTQTANTLLAGPTSGGAAAPAFRAQVAADLPAFSTLTAGTVALADQVPIYNASAAANRQDTIEDVLILLGRGYIDGLILSNDGTSPNTVIDIAAGVCLDSTNARIMKLAAFTKTTSAWAAGTGNGGLFSGTVGNSTWYHVFVIRKTSDGSIDAGIDTSITAANIPAGYGSYRRIGSILTNGSAAIVAFHQYGDEFWWDTLVKDVDVTNAGTAAVTRTLTVPTGLKVCAIFSMISYDSTQNTQHYVSSLDKTDQAASYTNAIEQGSSNTSNEAVSVNRIWTNTSAQIRSRVSQTSASQAVKIGTHGWVDPRGKNS